MANPKDSGWLVALHHGDLSRWNMCWQGRNCLAFDWEPRREETLACLVVDTRTDSGRRVKSKMDPLRAKRTVSKCTRSCLPANLGESAPEIAALSALNTPVSCYPSRKPDAYGRYERWLTTFMEAPLCSHKAPKLGAPTLVLELLSDRSQGSTTV